MTPEEQRSRLRTGQVWRHRVDPERYVLVTGYTLEPLGTRGHTVTVVSVHVPSSAPGGPWTPYGAEDQMLRHEFFEHYQLWGEAGNKDLGASTDLSSQLGKVRELRREGRHEEAEQRVGQRTGIAEHLRRNRQAAEEWTGSMDPRVIPAAELLHVRRTALAEQVALMQDEVDQLDAAIDALTKVEG